MREGKNQKEYTCDWLRETEKTRLIKLQDRESFFMDNVFFPLKTAGIQATYYKFLADLNPKILYPESVKGLEEETARTMTWFSQSLQDNADQLLGPGKIRVLPFSRIYNLFSKEYKEIYNWVRYSFQQDRDGNLESPLVKKKVLRNELEQLIEHCGLPDEGRGERIIELTKRVVSSYAAEEYVIRELLSQEGWFPNPVAIPNESMFTFPALANAYLKKEAARGLWLFLIYNESDEQ